MDYKSKTANDKEISIYYFSATGNSLKLSQDIAAAFGGAGLFRMTPSAGITVSDSRIVGFIFPVYMGGLPGIVRRFLESYPFRKGVYYFSIGTYYTYKGCAVSVVDKIMSGKGVRLDYGYNLPTVGNCLKEYEVSSVRRTKILERAELYTSRIIDDLKKANGKSLSRIAGYRICCTKGCSMPFQSLALELLLGKWLYGMWCLRTCMSREQYYAEKRSAPVGNRLRGLPCLRTLVSPECHSDREVQRAAAIPSSSCKKNDAVPCGMMGSYAAYPEIPVCFPFVGFHRNQPVLALFMPTGHRNDMDDLTHPCHHLEESAHVLEYPHASLFAGYREWSNSMYQPSLTGLYNVVSLYVLR